MHDVTPIRILFCPSVRCVCFWNTRSDRCWKNNKKNQDLRWHLCRWETFFVCSCFHNFPLLWMNVTSSFTKNKFLFSNSTSSVVLWHINACYRTKQLCVSRQGLEKVFYLPGSWMLHETQLSVLSPPRAGSVWQKLQSFPKLVSLLQITAAKWQKSQHNIFFAFHIQHIFIKQPRCFWL